MKREKKRQGSRRETLSIEETDRDFLLLLRRRTREMENTHTHTHTEVVKINTSLDAGREKERPAAREFFSFL